MRIERQLGVVTVLAITLACAASAHALAEESRRLARAKDYIADEQWGRAIEALRLTINDPKETRRDEALYWLAHSLNQSGDPAASVETISRLEREFPASIWVKAAQSLRIEIAVRLNRSDVLWWTALSPPLAPVPVKRPLGRPGSRGESKAPPPRPEMAKAFPPAPPPPAKVWYSEELVPDPDLRIQALGALILMKVDAEKAIPVLSDIAFTVDDPAAAGRAIFWLAQSQLPKARETVVQVAKTGTPPVQVTAVKELIRWGGPEVSDDVLQVYGTANDIVKQQIIKSFGERAERSALLRIVQSEKEANLKGSAIVCLGQSGEAEQLFAMYKTASIQVKRPIIVGLFSGRADAQLIRIAETERDPALRQQALERLRLLGTPRAKEYLQKVAEKR